jgi:dynein heavy chain
VAAGNLLKPLIESSFTVPRAGTKALDQNSVILLNDPHPKSYWLSAFFFPQGFLAAVLQRHARTSGISIDTLHFDFHVYSDETDPSHLESDTTRMVSDAGIIVYGLHIDGARWDPDKQTLFHSLPGHRFAHLPPVHFVPVLVNETSCDNEVPKEVKTAVDQPNVPDGAVPVTGTRATGTKYACPVYQTAFRSRTLATAGQQTSNLVTVISLDCGAQQSLDLWTMRGVALLCQLDD